MGTSTAQQFGGRPVNGLQTDCWKWPTGRDVPARLVGRIQPLARQDLQRSPTRVQGLQGPHPRSRQGRNTTRGMEAMSSSMSKISTSIPRSARPLAISLPKPSPVQATICSAVMKCERRSLILPRRALDEIGMERPLHARNVAVEVPVEVVVNCRRDLNFIGLHGRTLLLRHRGRPTPLHASVRVRSSARWCGLSAA
jgi:hypothetical protein